MKRIPIILSVIALMAASVIGESCSSEKKDVGEVIPADSVLQEESGSGSIVIAVTPTLDCLPLFVASEEGLFEEAGLDVALAEYTAQMDCDTAIQHRWVQVVATDLVRAEYLRTIGTSLSFLTATDAHWQLLSNRQARIAKLQQLDDKMLAMTRYSATDMLGDLAVDSVRLKPERVFRIQVNDLAVRLRMLREGIMDAALLPEPQATEARNAQARLLTTSQDANLQLGVIAFRDSSLSDSVQKKLISVYDHACDSINNKGLNAFSHIIMKWCGVTQQTIDSLPPTINFGHSRAPRNIDVERAKAWLIKKTEKIDAEQRYVQ